MRSAVDSIAPKLSLDRFVENVRSIEPLPGRAFDVELLPNGRTTLIFRVLADGTTSDVSVSGPRTHAHFKHATGVTRVVMVQFKPGWSAPFVGGPANAFTDRVVFLQDIWGRPGGELHRELLAAKSLDQVMDRLRDALVLRAQHTVEPASGPLARRAVRLLEAGEARIDCVADQLGVTARHLRRAFIESVGVGPKEFARTVRLQRAVERARSSTDWAGIAADAGYYDQAHLIADFRQLVGLTPGAFSKRYCNRASRFAANDSAPPRAAEASAAFR